MQEKSSEKIKKVSDRLRAVLERRNLTQEDLARSLRVSKGTIGNWMSDANGIRPSNREKLRKFFGDETAAYIFCETDSEPRAGENAQPMEKETLPPNHVEVRFPLHEQFYAAMERQRKKENRPDVENLALHACMKYLETNGQLVEEVEGDKTASARARPRDGSTQRTGAKER